MRFANVTVFHSGGLGDLVLAAGLLDALRRGEPTVRITLACRNELRGVASLMPEPPDAVTGVPVNPYLHSEPSLALTASLREWRRHGPVDTFIAASYELGWLDWFFAARLRASRSIAVARADPPRGLLTCLLAEFDLAPVSFEGPEVGENAHEAARYAALARWMGTEDPAYSAWVLPEDAAQRTRERLAEMGLESGDYLACFPLGAVREKWWPAERYRQVLGGVCADSRLPVLLLGSEAERAELEAMRDSIHGSRLFLGGPEDLPLLAGLLADCRAWLGNDTGPMHLAQAYRKPGVAVFGGGAGSSYGPWAAGAIGLIHPLPCFGCRWNCAFGHGICVESVPTSAVASALREALEGRAAPPRFSSIDNVPPEMLALIGEAAARYREADRDRRERLALLVEVKAEAERRRAVIEQHHATAVGRLIEDELRWPGRRQEASAAHSGPVAGSDVKKAAVAGNGAGPGWTEPVAAQPLVTIITPSFNQAQFLRATIESVLRQDYPHIEYIIMDGGSTDGSADVAAEYAGRLTWISERDRGQSHAINKGFRMARGAIVAWLNSDDLLLDGAVTHAVEALTEQRTAGAVYGEGYLIDREGNITSKFPYTQPFDLWRLAHLSDYILQQTVFFRKTVIEEVGYLREDLEFTMDWDLLIRIGRLYPLWCIPHFLGCLREYPEAKSFSGGRRRIGEIRRLLREHTGRRYPPGWIVYGMETYSKLWAATLRRYSPGVLSTPAKWAEQLVVYACGYVAGRALEKAQGLYAGGWAGPRLRYMLSSGCSGFRVHGTLPSTGWLSGQTLEVKSGGLLLARHRLAPGRFSFDVAVPETLSRGVLSIELTASHYFVPAYTSQSLDFRQLSYRLDGIDRIETSASHDGPPDVKSMATPAC